MAGDDVTIIIRADNGQAVRALRDTEGRLRDMRGRFVSEGSVMSGAMNRLSASIGGVRGALIPLATAAVPLMASMTAATLKTAGAAAGAGVAVAAFGAAVAGQASSLSEASEAQKKYNDAVKQYGGHSKQAAEAQRALSATLSSMPASTARAAVALSTLKDGFQDWSDSLADFTMTPVEKSFTLLGQLVPRLTDMAKGASSQLDRLVTVAGGAVASPGFDALADKLSVFANEALRDAVDGIIHFTRALSEGQASGPIQTFMEYAERNGPALQETLSNVGDAVLTLVEAASEAGPGMLTLVNAAAGLVAALPPELVATVMQLAVGLKLVTIASAGAAAVSTGIATLGTRIAALRAASTAAGGGMTGLAAAFGTLSRASKAALIGSGIGILVVALAGLSEMGKKTPPDVDKLTTSLRSLSQTGQVTGEAARSFGKDLSGLGDSLQKVIDPKGLDQFQQSLVSFFGTDSTPVKEAKENIDAVDKSLAQLVKGGQADLAASALDGLIAKLKDQGFSAKEVRGQLDDYKSALKDQAFEQQLAVEAMGIFGQAAQDTSAKLDAQKGAADGLRQSIIALNDVNRSAYDAQIQYEAALDDLTASFKEHGATLDIDTEAGRANAQAMSGAAKAQDELISSGLAAGESLGSMTKKSNELRETMMRLALEAFDGNKAKATEYINTLLGTPDQIKTLVKLEREEAITGLQAVQAEISKTPGAKTVTVETLNGAAIAALEAVGLKTKQLQDGRTQVFTANGQALGSIDAVRRAMNNLDGKTATTWTYHNVRTNYSTSRSVSGGKSVHEMVGATGGLFTGKSFRYADGGMVSGPGTGTSDDVFAPWLSDGEFVMKAAAVQKYGEKFMQDVNDGRLEMPGFAKGGKVSKAQARAKAQAESERQARGDARGDLTISYFGRRAGYRNTEFSNALGAPDSVSGLVSALNQWRSTILKATHGGVERSLLRSLDRAGRSLLGYERKLTSVNKALDGAKDKLADLKSAASQLRSSVKSGILGGANITRAAGAEESQVTINTLLSTMGASAGQSKQFAGMLKQLKGRGLSKDLLSQIAEAGIEGGGLETAAAVLGGSDADIRRLNSLQTQITSAADSAGKTAADAMYGAGIKAADGLVKGLKAKQDAIEKQMMKIAKAMEKSIKRALGIKSPSKVMEQVGSYTADGFAAGMRKNPRVAPAWASMLNAPRTGSGRAPAGGMREPVELVIRSGGSKMDDLLVEIIRQAVAHRGGNVQQALGRG